MRPKMSAKAERIVAGMRKLDRDDMLAVHREASRLVQPIYATVYRERWEAGVKAAESVQRAGYDAWRPKQAEFHKLRTSYRSS